MACAFMPGFRKSLLKGALFIYGLQIQPKAQSYHVYLSMMLYNNYDLDIILVQYLTSDSQIAATVN
jgi:hypothetical protein